MTGFKKCMNEPEQKLERVQKIIAQRSKYSRRQAEDLIEAGHVKVNNKKITLGDKAGENDLVTVNGNPLDPLEHTYYMLHKPKGYVTANSDAFTDKLVTELVPKKPRVYSVGRLDKDATGLILLTNDGDFANNIAHPRYEVQKTYIAVLKEKTTKEKVMELEKGVTIDGITITPKVIFLDAITVAIQVHVGLHKVVKRILKAGGHYVKTLHRTHIGNLALDVSVGDYRELTQQDKEKIFEKPVITKETFEQ